MPDQHLWRNFDTFLKLEHFRVCNTCNSAEWNFTCKHPRASIQPRPSFPKLKKQRTSGGRNGSFRGMLQSFVAFIRFSDRIGSDMKSWRRSLKIKCANHPDVNPNGTCKWIGDYRSSGACQPARQRAGQPAGLGSFLHSDPCTQAALRIRRPGKLYRARSRL